MKLAMSVCGWPPVNMSCVLYATRECLGISPDQMRSVGVFKNILLFWGTFFRDISEHK